VTSCAGAPPYVCTEGISEIWHDPCTTMMGAPVVLQQKGLPLILNRHKWPPKKSVARKQRRMIKDFCLIVFASYGWLPLWLRTKKKKHSVRKAHEWVSEWRSCCPISVGNALSRPCALPLTHRSGANWRTAYPTIYITENLNGYQNGYLKRYQKLVTKVVCIKTLLALVGHIKPAPTSSPCEGWMISGEETVFCWVPVP
jgi:hypothetical protein